MLLKIYFVGKIDPLITELPKQTIEKMIQDLNGDTTWLDFTNCSINVKNIAYISYEEEENND